MAVMAVVLPEMIAGSMLFNFKNDLGRRIMIITTTSKSRRLNFGALR